MTTLLLVRHGATAWTCTGRLQGRTDVDISAAGHADVVRLVPIVERWHPVTVIASPLARSLSTARILSPLEPIVDDRWIEAGLGEWEGHVPESIGSDYTRWRAGEIVPPGGEPRIDVAARVEAAVRAAAARPGPVLVVTHGGTIRAALARFVGLSTDHLEPVAAPSLTVLEVEQAAGRLRHLNIVSWADGRIGVG